MSRGNVLPLLARMEEICPSKTGSFGECPKFLQVRHKAKVAGTTHFGLVIPLAWPLKGNSANYFLPGVPVFCSWIRRAFPLAMRGIMPPVAGRRENGHCRQDMDRSNCGHITKNQFFRVRPPELPSFSILLFGTGHRPGPWPAHERGPSGRGLPS